jgi:hypothetical protein
LVSEIWGRAMSKGGLGALGMTNDLLRAGGGSHPVLSSLGIRRGQLGRGLGQPPPGTGLGSTSVTHLGFNLPPHYRLRVGGDAGASLFQWLQGRSLEELEELARRVGMTSPHGRLIQYAIMSKQTPAPPGLGSVPIARGS